MTNDKIIVGCNVEFSVPYFESSFYYEGKVLSVNSTYALVEYYEPLNDLRLKTHVLLIDLKLKN